MYCSAIPQIANGFAVSATNVSFAGLARFRCYKGFSFASGKEFEEILCTDDGRWTQTPKCKGLNSNWRNDFYKGSSFPQSATNCPILPPFQFGERTLQNGDGIGHGSVYGFQCTSGYRREGPQSIVCQPNGQWTSEQPQCKSRDIGGEDGKEAKKEKIGKMRGGMAKAKSAF